MENNLEQFKEPTIVKTDEGAKDGQNKCPKCGSTEIRINPNTGHLRCDFCRFEFEPEKVSGLNENINELQGQVMASGALDIVADANDVVTFKCSSCGAEVVIDTSESTQARCHWCRSTLSVNQQIPNGSIPDVVLPFQIKKEDAKLEIEKFVGKRKFFAHPKFTKEFTTNNIMGVYFPYMVVDINAHSTLNGQGEKLIRSYRVGSGDNARTRYDADLYNVNRDFDIAISGLTVESSKDKLNTNASDKTTNIINSIMPFDIENSVKWNSNYLKGYTSEKRDTNVSELRPLVETQAKDIAKFAVNPSLEEYNRGVRWDSQSLTVKGEQWKAAYLPVWLYSYQQVNGNKKLLHYVAVNARTKETMGSVPIHMPKLLLFSFLIEILAFILMIFTLSADSENEISTALLLAGPAFFIINYLRYRNKNARHTFETETKNEVSNLTGSEQYIKRLTGLSNRMMDGHNNKSITTTANNVQSKLMDDVIKSNPILNAINEQANNNNNKS